MNKGGTPANLKPFKKGHDERRNMDGAPKKIPSLDILLQNIVGEDGMSEIIDALQKKAKDGNIFAIQVMLDRQFGKPKQSVDVTSNGESLAPQIIIKPKEQTDESSS